MRSGKWREFILTLLILLALIGAVIGALVWQFTAPVRQLNRAAKTLAGASESEVVRELGPPDHVVTADSLKGEAVDYPWRGMNYLPVPTRPVRNKVLLYSWGGYALYVYIDLKGRVEHTARAGT